MELILKDASMFKKSIEAISVLIDEAELVVKEDGLELKATDPSQISMVDFSMSKDAFEKFEVEENRLGLDLDYLNQVLSRAQSSDKLTLSTTDNKAFLEVKFDGKAKRAFQVPLIDISSSEVPTPKIEFDAELTINSSFVQNALKDVALISSHITMGCDKDKFFVSANSSKGNLNEEATKDGVTITEFKVKADCKSMFPLDYLQDMLKAASGDISLFIKSNAPVKISYPIGDARITYFLAPRIENA